MLLASPDERSTEDGLKMSGNCRILVTWLSQHLWVVSAMCSQCEDQCWSECVFLSVKKWNRDKQKSSNTEHPTAAAFQANILARQLSHISRYGFEQKIEFYVTVWYIWFLSVSLSFSYPSINLLTHLTMYTFMCPCTHTLKHMSRRDILNWFWHPVFESQTQCLLITKSLPLLDYLGFCHFSFPLWKFCCAFCRWFLKVHIKPKKLCHKAEPALGH